MPNGGIEGHRQLHRGQGGIVLLTNPMPHTMATAKTLLQNNVPLLGVVSASDTNLGVPTPQYRRSLRRNGAGRFVHKAIGAGVYGLINRRRNREFYRMAYDARDIDATLAAASIPVISCRTYSDKNVVAWLDAIHPEILVVHSESWVPKKVREMARLVIGGHPGKTPEYRGGYSSFWALSRNRPEDLMWTIFHVDGGVDTGDVIEQGPIPTRPGDTFRTLDWRGMQLIAEAQARVIHRFQETGEVNRMKHEEIRDDSLFGLPTLAEYIRYRRVQKLAR